MNDPEELQEPQLADSRPASASSSEPESSEGFGRVAESNARLAAIVEHSDDAIISKDLKGIIKTWNRGAERLFGYTAEEAVGKSILMILPRYLQPEEPRILQQIESGRTVDHYETVRRRKDGALREISLTVSPIRNERGEVVGASKIARDITERKQVEAALRRSERLFRELADSMPQIIWAARPDGSVDYFNRRWFEFTGFSENLSDGDAWVRIIHPEDVSRALVAYRESIRTEKPYQMEYRFRDRASGSYRWFLGRSVPIRDEAGLVIRWFGTCTDIDDQKRAEEKLEQAVAERTASLRDAISQLEEFSYTVSHDLRAPLRGMQAYAEAVLQDFSSSLPSEAVLYLKRISASANRLDKMILDVLTFSRLARAEIVLEPVNLDQLVRQIVEHFPGFRPPQAEIEIGALETVLGHEPSLIQAISNLLNNAIKFVAPDTRPQVRIWSEPRDGTIRLYVRDNGIGIEPRYQPRLFRMFERVHSETKYEGTGVGLAIIRKAVERMGGRVGMESDGVHGSLFWLDLTFANPDPHS